MTVEAFLDEDAVPFDNTTLPQIVDVETGGVGIISTLRAMLVTTLGWSEPSSDLFKTPVDASGRFMDILCTRISASTIEFRLRDQNAVTICTRRITIDTSPGCDVFIHGSIYSVYIETLRAIPEVFRAHIVDPSPDLKSDHARYVCGSGYLTTAGTNDGNGDSLGDLFMLDAGATAVKDRIRRTVDSGFGYHLQRESPVRTKSLFLPIFINVAIAGPVQRWAGRLYHFVQHKFGVQPGAIQWPNIDTNLKVPFRTCFLTGDSIVKMAVRVKEE